MGATPSAPVVLTQAVITATDPVNCGTPGRIESDLQRVPSDATPLLMGIDIGTMCVLNGIAWIVTVLTTPGLPTEAHEWLRLFVIFACSACEQGVVTKASLVPLLQLLHEAFVTWRMEAEHGADLHGLAEDAATSMFDRIFALADAARLTFEQRPLAGPVLGEFAVGQVLKEARVAAGGGIAGINHVAHLSGAAAGVMLVLVIRVLLAGFEDAE